MYPNDVKATYTTEVGATWAGTHVFRARGLYLPQSISEAADVIARHDRIRAIGTRHSFNDIADGDVMISLVDIDPAMELDEETRTVQVSSAVRYGVLASWLHERGWALKNMGSLPHISIGGATATGTHGSGDSNGTLTTSIAALQLVTAGGEIQEFQRSTAGFGGVVLSLGALGVITRVSLDVEPTYDVRQDVYRELPWDHALEYLNAVMASGYSVSIFTSWDEPTISRVLVKTRMDSDTDVPDSLFGARAARQEDTGYAALGANRTVQGGVPGPWLERLPHFRLDANPSNGDEIQSEYFVDRSHGPAAIAALRGLTADIAPHLLTTEIRSIAADQLWLSMAFDRPSLGIHFTWMNRPEAVAGLLPRIERALAPFDARPHWGKAFSAAAADIGPLYPRFRDFQQLRDQMDPTRKFGNDYLDRVLGAMHGA